MVYSQTTLCVSQLRQMRSASLEGFAVSLGGLEDIARECNQAVNKIEQVDILDAQS